MILMMTFGKLLTTKILHFIIFQGMLPLSRRLVWSLLRVFPELLKEGQFLELVSRGKLSHPLADLFYLS